MIGFSILAGILIFSYVLLIISYLQKRKNISIQKKYDYAKQEIEIKNQYYKKVSLRLEVTKKLHHDMKHHIHLIKAFYENNEKDLARDLITNLDIEWNSVLKKIDSGNLLLDYLLNEWTNVATEKGIKVDIIARFPEKIRIPMSDLAVIIGNTFHNAIEACERIKNQSVHKVISCYIAIENDMLIYHISNTKEGDLVHNGKFYISSKLNKEFHGIGLLSVEEMILKYNGMIDIEDDGESFQFMATMPAENVVG